MCCTLDHVVHNSGKYSVMKKRRGAWHSVFAVGSCPYPCSGLLRIVLEINTTASCFAASPSNSTKQCSYCQYGYVVDDDDDTDDYCDYYHC